MAGGRVLKKLTKTDLWSFRYMYPLGATAISIIIVKAKYNFGWKSCYMEFLLLI